MHIERPKDEIKMITRTGHVFSAKIPSAPCFMLIHFFQLQRYPKNLRVGLTLVDRQSSLVFCITLNPNEKQSIMHATSALKVASKYLYQTYLYNALRADSSYHI